MKDLLRYAPPGGTINGYSATASEPRRRRRDLAAHGGGPLPIHECPCDIGVVVHENRART